MLNDGEIVTSVKEESDPVDDETDEGEDNNESCKGPSNADAFSALETAMQRYERQSECFPTQSLLLKKIRDCSKKKNKGCPVTYTAWNAYGFRLSEQSRIRTVSGPK
ncbi:uncharacterized protein TNCV_1853361 [Trichonephila clavipes]|nr:uncharacterized protein TNCV_1853361 [Trichonephila clavipes]